jgi:hypothetical protein
MLAYRSSLIWNFEIQAPCFTYNLIFGSSAVQDNPTAAKPIL